MKSNLPANPAEPEAHSGDSWVIAQTILLVGVGIAAPLTPGAWPKGASVSIGSTAFLYAAWTGLCGVFRLGRNRTAEPAPRAGGTLVTTGIYALIRHPLYAAMMAMGVGWACFWSSGTALAIAGVFILFLHAKARFEERLLAARFGDYPRYASRVPRYIPGWPNPRRELP